nr:hypothetical protein CFP56_10047 [Quercus suber]
MGDLGANLDHTQDLKDVHDLHGRPAFAMENGQFASGSTSSAGTGRNILSNLGILNNLNPEKNKTKDGQPAKRRGPKPDSKPALTRRQELNRQAQRTHRERKELYIKQLEQEVLRLKEVFVNFVKERDAVAEENRRLRELLASHGISYDFGTTPVQFQRENSAYGPSSSGSISGSYVTGSDSTTYSPPPMPKGSMQSPISNYPQRPGRSMAQLPNTGIDHDQIGIDFVLTLERPCMDHMQYLLVRSHNVEGQLKHHPMENADDSDHEHMSGHVLMSTAPPQSHIMEKPAENYPFQMPQDVGTEGLSKLLDLSNRLPIDHCTEITPVMAWTMVFRHEQLTELTTQDLQKIKDDLSTKVRCYGFGAVVEEFEVQDAIDNVLAAKQLPAATMMSDAKPQLMSLHQPVSAY